MTLGLKYKLVTATLNFGGTRHHLISDAHTERAHQFLARTLSSRISSWRTRSVHAPVPYAHAQHALNALFKYGILRLYWAYAWETDAYAQGTHQFLTRMLRVRIIHWKGVWYLDRIRNHGFRKITQIRERQDHIRGVLDKVQEQAAVVRPQEPHQASVRIPGYLLAFRIIILQDRRIIIKWGTSSTRSNLDHK